MSLDWQTFKSALGQNASVTYIDEEFSEIPIDSECEFQEALRLARLNKSNLRVIIYENKSQSSQKRYLNIPPAKSVSKLQEKLVFEKINATLNSPDMKETCCHCNEDGQPEWFTNYMKRFKKQLFHELMSYIHSAVNSAIEKEKKLTPKLDTHDVPCKKRESLFPGSTPIKKEKLEKDSPDVIDQREAKLQRKLEKLLTSKSERLEKLDNKIFKSSNEEWLLKEAKLNSKRKFSRTRKSDKNEGCPPVVISGRIYCPLVPVKNSISRTRQTPMGSSSVILKGKMSKSEDSPHIKCRAVDGEKTFEPEISGRIYPALIPIKNSISHSRQTPMESSSVIMKGKSEGPNDIRCRAVDGEEKCQPEFICGEGREPFTSEDKSSGISFSSKESHGTTGEKRNSVGALIDFQKDVITSSQKKIEENIMEIQKRLHDIDLLGPLTRTESIVNEEGASGNKEKRKTGFDLSEDVEVIKKNLKQKLEPEKVLFGIDCLSLKQPLNETCNLTTSEKKVSGNNNTDNLENIASNVESEHCTDSEMSVIFVSEEEEEEEEQEEEEEEEEEEENFVVVTWKSPSPANSVNDDKVSPERESETRNEQPEVEKAKNADDKDEAKEETEQHKEEMTETHFCHSNSRSRRSPFAEETFKPKKIKSKSTEYHFSMENLTNPTFVQRPEGVSEGLSTLRFTAGEEGNSQKHHMEKREDCKEKEMPKAFDALGRVIYAVNSSGRCLPVEHMLKQKEHTSHPTRVPSGVPPGVSPGIGCRSADRAFCPHQQERRSDRSKEVPTVSILPNALMNGASNVASIAFNTAKSVINNLQSAFVSEGKTESRHPAYGASAFQAFQDRRVSSEMLIRLCDMGFLNIELNRQLLLLNGNDLGATVEELIRLHRS